MSLTINLDETAKRRIRRGYYGVHHKPVDDATFNNLSASDIHKYRLKADKMDKKDRRGDIFGWVIGIIFYGGIGLLALSSIGGDSAGSTSDPETNYSAPSSSLYQDEPASYDDSDYYDSSYQESEDDECDPDYSGCVPDVSYDLDCSDIGEEVEVYGSDYHGLDGDGDGYGCESYY